jgi:hypothetical protein
MPLPVEVDSLPSPTAFEPRVNSSSCASESLAPASEMTGPAPAVVVFDPGGWALTSFEITWFALAYTESW